MTQPLCPSVVFEVLVDRAAPIFLLSLSFVAAIGSLLLAVA
jgi:hypothetical protein